MRYKFLLSLIISIFFSVTLLFGQPGKAVSKRTITVITEPKTIVWLDDIRRGVTDETGKLVVNNVPAGSRKIRTRANGFKEISTPLLATQKGDVKIKLIKTTDEAELAYQEAEVFITRDREKAIAAYQKAVSLRPKYAEAYLGLARVLSANGDNESALQAIVNARKSRLGFAEASAVEGRIHKENSEEEKAIAAFKRSITEGKGFQPEAHTGLGLLYKDKAELLPPTPESQEEREQYYELATSELRKAITQLSGAPDAKEIYQLLGDTYYKAKKYQDAIKIYEEFITVFPDSNEVTTMRSLIVQTTKEMNGEQ